MAGPPPPWPFNGSLSRQWLRAVSVAAWGCRNGAATQGIEAATMGLRGRAPGCHTTIFHRKVLPHNGSPILRMMKFFFTSSTKTAPEPKFHFDYSTKIIPNLTKKGAFPSNRNSLFSFVLFVFRFKCHNGHPFFSDKAHPNRCTQDISMLCARGCRNGAPRIEIFSHSFILFFSSIQMP